ncbi:hypothetical protein L7F22_046181 [Adiantum nelumboides]|nr:hypothetical protein [Adiantum nelumboides]
MEASSDLRNREVKKGSNVGGHDHEQHVIAEGLERPRAVEVAGGSAGGVLIPGLPNHIALKCLVQVPRLYHGNMRGVCRGWREAVRSAEFYRWRRESGLTDPWLVVLSCDHLGSTNLDFFAYDLPSRQLLFKALLPPFDVVMRASSPRVDMVARGAASSDYKLVAMNEYFVVLNWQRDGLWTEELPFLIYNILTNSWKKGAAVGVRRHSFCCGVVQGKLYIVGGTNLEGSFEASTECYDFAKDEWRFVARLPASAPAPLVLEDDAVFRGKLYVRTASKQFWVYDPLADRWAQDPSLNNPNANHLLSANTTVRTSARPDHLQDLQAQFAQAANEGQLVATDNSLFSLTRDNAFHRFDWKEKAWQLVGRINPADSATSPAAQPRLDITSCNGLSKEARRVFAFGNDIFVLASGKPGWHSRFLQDDGRCKYHRLFLGISSYRAGAIVQA